MIATPHAVLKTRTDPAHRALERVPEIARLMSDGCTRADIARALGGHYAVYAAFEPRLRAQSPACLRIHDAFRYRAEAVREDLRRLGVDPAPSVGVVPADFETDPAWLGYLYVTEGSMLGGRVIHRHLQSIGAIEADDVLATFMPYRNEAGLVWRRFVQILNDALSTDEALAQAVDASQETFLSFIQAFKNLREGEHGRANRTR